MWRGIFITAGSTLMMSGDGVLVEDADSAVVAENTPTIQANYIIAYDYFNKNYKDIVTEPYSGTYGGEVNNNIFTCRDLKGYNTCSDTNWRSKHFATMLYPHTGVRTYMGMDFRSVNNFPAIPTTDFLANYFDNMEWGIHDSLGNISVYAEHFEYIGSATTKGAAIESRGNFVLTGYSLTVGGTSTWQPNYFLQCFRGVIGLEHITTFNVYYNFFNTITNWGVGDLKSILPSSTANIEHNQIINATVGIVAAKNVVINDFIAYNTIVSGCSSIGIELHEVSNPPTAVYVIESNQVKAPICIYGNGLAGANAYSNTLFLYNDHTCFTAPQYEYGVNFTANNKSSAIDNQITTVDLFDTTIGIYAANSQATNVCGNIDTNMSYGIEFMGNSLGTTIYNNTLYNTRTGERGMYFNAVPTTLTEGNTLQPTYNEWSGSWNPLTTCRSKYTLAQPRFWWKAPAPYDPLGGLCAGILPFAVTCTLCSPYSCGGPPPPIVLQKASMDSVATGNIAVTSTPDTTLAVAQQGLGQMVMQDTSLLSDSTLQQFNDSLQSSPMGAVMQVDTMTYSPANWNTSTLATLNAISPVTNLDANMQYTAQGYLNDVMNDSLTPNQLDSLRILAGMCPLLNGTGVFRARAILVDYDSAGTFYLDTNCACNSGWKAHSHIKHTNKTTQTDSTLLAKFNLYPNPNNGGFTLTYQLQSGQTGTFTIFNTIGEKVAMYDLDASTNTMKIDEEALNNGVYLYNIRVNNSIVKTDKLVIIK